MKLTHFPQCLLVLLILPLSSCLSSAQNSSSTSIKSSNTQQRQSSSSSEQVKIKKQVKKSPAPRPQEGTVANFEQKPEVLRFINEMVQRYNFNQKALLDLFSKTRYLDTSIRLVKPSITGKPKNWQAYRARFVEPLRINSGVTFWNDNESTLKRAEEQYGVPPEIITAIIGIETIYGRHTGNFRAMDAITTLAFNYPATSNREMRMTFFQKELENLLLFARESNIDPLSLQSSYAGAIGWPQFMPSSIRQYAVDFDGDGTIDLRNSSADVIGSVAHFLAVHGWQRDMPLVYPVALPSSSSRTEDSTSAMPQQPSDNNAAIEHLLNQGLQATFSLDDIKTAGITPEKNPPDTLRYGLIDLQNGDNPTEYWLATNNFYAITQYNRSYFYAMAVIDLGHAIRAAHQQ